MAFWDKSTNITSKPCEPYGPDYTEEELNEMFPDLVGQTSTESEEEEEEEDIDDDDDDDDDDSD